MLCSGPVRRKGWSTLDAKPGADFVATIPPLPEEMMAVKWDAIEWIHGVTSFYPWEAAEIVRELRAVLAPEGVLIMEQPDARKCDPVSRPEWLFGDPSLRDPLHMNKWAYTPEKLIGMLREAGFSKVIVLGAEYHDNFRDFRVEARL